ncbi:MAG TPA: non-canonical purine NTP pyrophosphatase, partial [Bacteroides sp.]|nr:non-canonical purine NTP pyrophosphatase [Bacteroides sp.]
NGAPGVYSARYSRIGNPVFPEMEVSAGNIKKLLQVMEGMQDRRARFRTVISLILNDIEYYFEGIVEGEIATEPAGQKGFGYDPVFRPAGYDRTFAEMNLSLKNRISHRAKAVERLVEFLRNM